MKKIILMAGLLLGSMAQAQEISVTGNGEVITDGQVFTYNSLSADESELTLIATNISDQNINIKMRLDSMTNTTGQNVQFCFGELCFFSVSEGSMVPTNPSGVTLEPGDTNNPNDHFWNNNPGIDGTSAVEYVITFVKVDDDGAVIDELLTFTYIYQPTLSTRDFSTLQDMGITINQTLVKEQLEITTEYAGKMDVYAVNGQLVKSVVLKSGYQSVNASGMSAGIYIARFTNANNQTHQIRFVKQ